MLPVSPLPFQGDVAFVGGGHMARSLVAGLIARGIDPRSIRVAEPVAALRDGLQRDLGVRVFADNADAVAAAATWLFAAKPDVIGAVCEALAGCAQSQRPLVMSIAAGITTADIARWLGGGIAVVRAMPNTPALLGAGVTGMYANARVDAAQCLRAERLMRAAGEVVWLTDESLMDAVTAVSGSGPAYVFLLAETMLDAARSQGLPDDAAHALVLRTILGAARMLTEADAGPAELRRRVTSAGGTTQAALEVLENGGFRALLADAIDAAAVRSRELSSVGG
jgi:pyrroline-5-carboxylate reductase